MEHKYIVQAQRGRRRKWCAKCKLLFPPRSDVEVPEEEKPLKCQTCHIVVHRECRTDGDCNINVSEDMLQEIITAIDEDGDRNITLSEVEKWISMEKEDFAEKAKYLPSTSMYVARRFALFDQAEKDVAFSHGRLMQGAALTVSDFQDIFRKWTQANLVKITKVVIDACLRRFRASFALLCLPATKQYVSCADVLVWLLSLDNAEPYKPVIDCVTGVLADRTLALSELELLFELVPIPAWQPAWLYLTVNPGPPASVSDLFHGRHSGPVAIATRSLNVFLSSPYCDFLTERSTLAKYFIPGIRKKLADRGWAIFLCDLQRGVLSEQLGPRWMDLRLDTIQRCKRLSPYLNYAALTGQKYGTMFPLPLSFPKSEFDVLVPLVHEEDPEVAAFLSSAYVLDENTYVPLYVFRVQSAAEPMREEEVERQLAVEWCPRVSTCLANAANRVSSALPPGRAANYRRNPIEREAILGLLQAPAGAGIWVKRTINHFRDDHVGVGSEQARTFTDFEGGRRRVTPASKALDELTSHIGKIAEALEGCPANKISILVNTWNKKGMLYTDPYIASYLNELCNDLSRCMLTAVTRIEAEQPKEISHPIFLELAHHQLMAAKSIRDFQGREDECHRITHFFTTASSSPLVITGESGVGKSFLAAFASRAAAEVLGTHAIVVKRFIGTTPLSHTGRGLLRVICFQLAVAFQEPVVEEGKSFFASLQLLDDTNRGRITGPQYWLRLLQYSYRQLCNEFASLLNRYSTSSFKLVLVFDSLDQLTDDDRARSALEWLPAHTAKNIWVVLTTRVDEQFGCYQALFLKGVGVCDCLEVPPFTLADIDTAIAKWLLGDLRRLTAAQSASIHKACGRSPLPLFCRLLYLQSRSWRSWDNAHVGDTLARTVEDVFVNMVLRVEETNGPALVSHAVGYLCAARCGLSECELLDVLSCDDEVLETVFVGYHPRVRRLPTCHLVRVLRDLSPFLVDVVVDRVYVLRFVHRQFAEIASRRYLDAEGLNDIHVPIGRARMHEALAAYFSGKWAKGKPCWNRNAAGGKEETKYENRYVPEQHLVISGTLAQADAVLNVRRARELVFQQLYANDMKVVSEELSSLQLIEIKCRLEQASDLESDYMLALGPLFAHAWRGLQEQKEKVAEFWRFFRGNVYQCVTNPTNILTLALQSPPYTRIGRQALSLVGGAFALSSSYSCRSLPVNPLPDPCMVVLDLHTQEVLAVAYSLLGKYIVSGGRDQTVRVWNGNTHLQFAKLTGHSDAVLSVCISKDRVASGSNDRTAIVWDLSSKRLLVRFEHKKAVTGVSFAQEGRLLVTGCLDGLVRVWGCDSGRRLGRVWSYADCHAVCVAPNDKYVATASFGEIVCVWTLKQVGNDGGVSLTHANRLHGPMDTVRSVCFSADSHFVSACADDTVVRVWRVDTAECVAILRGHTGPVLSVSFTRDGRSVVSGSDDQSVRVWDLASGTMKGMLVPSNGILASARAVTTSSCGRWVISSCAHQLWVWDINNAPPVAGTGEVITSHSEPVHTVHFTPSMSHVVSASGSRTIKVWDMDSAQELENHLLSPKHDMTCMHVGSGDNLAVVGCGSAQVILVPLLRAKRTNDGCVVPVKVFQVPSLAKPRTRVPFGQRVVVVGPEVRCVRISSDGRWVLAGCSDKSVHLFDKYGKRPPVPFVGHKEEVLCLSYPVDFDYKKQFVSGSADKCLRVWDVATATTLFELRGHTQAVTAVTWNSDWAIASGSADSSVRYWDCHHGKSTSRLRTKGPVQSIVGNSSVVVAACGGTDCAIRLWNEDGGDLAVLHGHSAPVLGVDVSPDGFVVASAGEDHCVHVWWSNNRRVQDAGEAAEETEMFKQSPLDEIERLVEKDASGNLINTAMNENLAKTGRRPRTMQMRLGSPERSPSAAARPLTVPQSPRFSPTRATRVATAAARMAARSGRLSDENDDSEADGELEVFDPNHRRPRTRVEVPEATEAMKASPWVLGPSRFFYSKHQQDPLSMSYPHSTRLPLSQPAFGTPLMLKRRKHQKCEQRGEKGERDPMAETLFGVPNLRAQVKSIEKRLADLAKDLEDDPVILDRQPFDEITSGLNEYRASSAVSAKELKRLNNSLQPTLRAASARSEELHAFSRRTNIKLGF